ncbi:trypsin-like serine peptidase [Priestia megaterium]|uniref:trypsin-like serine peptidase n=1 Tax=Priestia megaterium TaxID=1404 RepID=UPI00406BA79C
MNIISILNDKKLREDVIKQLGRKEFQNRFEYDVEKFEDILNNWNESVSLGPEEISKDMESIIRSIGRPVLQIIHSTYVPPISSEWNQKLSNYRENIEHSILAVGRIEVRDHPALEWIGTGWLLKSNIIVTNCHVANEFAKKEGGDFTFRYNFRNIPIQARIDFREEYGQPEQFEFNVEKVLYMGDFNDELDPSKPDLAFLQISSSSLEGSLPEPIKLSEERISANKDVVVIGYPARDSRVGNQEEMEKIFESIYDVKRLAPGQAYPSDKEWIINHDCTTLGGNSGSVVLDIETGKAIGLHVKGHYKDKNYAISSTKILEMLNSIS